VKLEIQLHIDDRLLAGPRWLARRPVALAALLLGIGTATALAVVDPGDFQNGTTIDATAVNTRFKRLYEAVGELEARGARGGVPVGTVIASMLTPQQMDQTAPPDETWVIADGAKYPTTAWGTLTSNASVPDLRGVFLRGQNLGRVMSEGNPDGSALGAYQNDMFAAHRHSLVTGSVPRDGGACSASFNGLLDSASIYAKGADQCNGDAMNYAGGDETRPRNVTVNYFIRVN